MNIGRKCEKINVIGIVDGADEEVECTLNINILIYSRLLWEEVVFIENG